MSQDPNTHKCVLTTQTWPHPWWLYSQYCVIITILKAAKWPWFLVWDPPEIRTWDKGLGAGSLFRNWSQEAGTEVERVRQVRGETTLSCFSRSQMDSSRKESRFYPGLWEAYGMPSRIFQLTMGGWSVYALLSLPNPHWLSVAPGQLTLPQFLAARVHNIRSS